jgi:hypothetical protein
LFLFVLLNKNKYACINKRNWFCGRSPENQPFAFLLLHRLRSDAKRSSLLVFIAFFACLALFYRHAFISGYARYKSMAVKQSKAFLRSKKKHGGKQGVAKNAKK